MRDKFVKNGVLVVRFELDRKGKVMMIQIQQICMDFCVYIDFFGGYEMRKYYVYMQEEKVEYYEQFKQCLDVNNFCVFIVFC